MTETSSPVSPAFTGVSHIDLSVSDLDQSETFYTTLLGGTKVLDGRSEHNHLASRYLIHPDSLFILGLVQHDDSGAEPFNERHLGLDHLSFNVADRSSLDEWAAHLDAHGIIHSPISEEDLWDVLVLRDPDNIQLEFFFMKPEAASLLTSAQST